MGRIVAIAALVISLIALWVLAALLWPRLPERIPMHFDFSGVPDRWEARSATNWFLLPALATVFTAFLAATGASIPWMLRRFPHLVNVPRKAELLALPEDARRRALSPTIDMMLWVAAIINAMMANILYGSWMVGTGAWKTLPAIWPLLAIVGMIAAAVILGTWRTSQRILIEWAIVQSTAKTHRTR